VDVEPPADALPALTSKEETNRPVLRGIKAQVAVDAALPKAFQNKVEKLVAQRLGVLGAPARVGIEIVAFPPRKDERSAAQLQTAPPPQPQIITLTTPPPPEPKVVPPRERAASALAEAAPWLVMGGLASVTVLIAAGILFFAINRGHREGTESAEEGQSTAGALEQVDPSGARQWENAARRLKVLESVSADRVAAARVLHEALERGESQRIAVWLREVGTPLLELIPAEAARSPQLIDELSRGASDEKDVSEALSILDGRLTAARLGGGLRGAQASFDFLHGPPIPDVAAALLALDPVDRSIALRHAPGAVRDAILGVLPLEERRELVAQWSRPSAAPTEVSRVAARLRSSLARFGGVSTAREALAELLSTFPAPDQEALFEQMGRESPDLVEGLVVESALPRIDAGLLGRAVLQIAPGTLLLYLAGAEPAFRAALFAATPTSLRTDLESELAHRAAPSPNEFRMARRQVMRAIADERSRQPMPGLVPRVGP
jgi:hypothetical protein